MGYTTDFDGQLRFKRPLSQKRRDYINCLSRTRRMKRDVSKLMDLYNGKHSNPFVIGPEKDFYGVDGEFFARDEGNFGQEDEASIIDYNTPPSTQPGLWCQWIVTEDGKYLEWDGGEKFYNYVEWLEYLIEKLFIPWGCTLNGEIYWQGEDSMDMGKIVVRDNIVRALAGKVTYENE